MTISKREYLHFVLKKYTWRSLAIQNLYNSKLIFLQRNEIYESIWVHILSVCMWELNTPEHMNPHYFCADNGVDLTSILPDFLNILACLHIGFKIISICCNVLFKKCCITSTFCKVSNSKLISECGTLFIWAFKNFWQILSYLMILGIIFISDANNNK